MAKRTAEHLPDGLKNLTNQSRAAALGGKQEAAIAVKKTVGKILDVAVAVVKQGATDAKNLVSEKVVVQLVDVLVIGGGLSGLSFAEALLEISKTLRVYVLEENRYLGGQMKTEAVYAGVSNLAMDVGGGWLSKTQHTNTVSACQRFGIELIKQYGTASNEGRHVIVQGGPETRRTYMGDIPPFSILSLWQIRFRIIGKIERLLAKLPKDDTLWSSPIAKDLDSFSVASFFSKRMHSTLGKNIVNTMVLQAMGCESCQVSLLQFLLFVRKNGSLDNLFGTDDSGFYGNRILGGTQELCEKIGETIKTYENSTIELDAKVVQIRARSTGCDHPLVVTTSHNKKYLARVVVIAAPPSKFIETCVFVPRVPSSMTRLAQCSFYGVKAKAIAVYPQPFWRRSQFSGFAKNLNPSPQACVSIVYDQSNMQMAAEAAAQPRDSHALVCFIYGDIAIEVGNWSEEKRKESILNSLALMFPMETHVSSAPLSFKDFFPVREEGQSSTGHVIYPPGQYLNYNSEKLFSNPLAHSRDNRPLIFFAASEIASNFAGTMEGAILKGREVANEVNAALAALGKKRAGAPETDSDQFWKEEEKGGVPVLEDDVWTILETSRSASQRRS